MCLWRMEQLCGLDDHHILLRNAINKNDELGNCGLELQTNVKRNEGSRRFHNHGEGLLLVESAYFTFKTLLRHYAEWELIPQ